MWVVFKFLPNQEKNDQTIAVVDFCFEKQKHLADAKCLCLAEEEGFEPSLEIAPH